MVKTGGFLTLTLILILVLISGCNPYQRTLHHSGNNDISIQIIKEFEANYPFTGHKAIDWVSFETDLHKQLNYASYNDSAYLNIRELFFKLPDARINIISGKDQKLMKETTGGYCGFEVSRDESDQCIIIKVDSMSDAWSRGLRPGNKILGWNGTPVQEVLQNKCLIWGYHPADKEFRHILQDYYLTRGPVGSSVELFYETETGNNRGLRLDFVPKEIIFRPQHIGIPTGIPDKNFKIINERTGIWTISAFSPSSLYEFKNEILPKLSQCQNLIIDLRENQGGNDAIAADLAGYFISEESLYDETLVRLADTNTWNKLGHIHAEPKELIYEKSIIILIGPLCSGAGEGFARVIADEENIQTLGLWSTYGSFSYPGGEIKIPGYFSIHYPIGMSLDENEVILIESPGDYGGGIYPDIRIPVSSDLLIALSAGYDLLLDEAIMHLGR